MRNKRNKQELDYGDTRAVGGDSTNKDVVDLFKKNKSMTFEDLNKINTNQEKGKKISMKLRDIIDVSDDEEDEVLLNFRNKNANKNRAQLL